METNSARELAYKNIKQTLEMMDDKELKITMILYLKDIKDRLDYINDSTNIIAKSTYQ